MKNEGNIILVGLMGAGKTTVGRLLAKRLKRPFYDSDEQIERRCGVRIPVIFDIEGEAGFRARERAAVALACSVSEAVVATGGGTLVDPENRRRLLASGSLICLSATPEEILRRVRDVASRPLLATANGDRLGRVEALLAERAAVYGLAAHQVDTTGLSVDEVVERVRALVAGR